MRAIRLRACILWLAAGALLSGCLESNPQPFPGSGKDTGGGNWPPAKEVIPDYGNDAVPALVDVGADSQALPPDLPSMDTADVLSPADATNFETGTDSGDGGPPDATTTGTLTIGPDGNEPFAPSPDNSDGVQLNLFGDLQLAGEPALEDRLWLPASVAGTVTLFSTKSESAVGKYHGCQGESVGEVDLAGNFWQCCLPTGTVTAYAGGLPACLDKNSSGIIDTSKDLDGNGKIEGDEMLSQGQDECVLGQIEGALADCHGLATDPDGRVWATGHTGQTSIRRFLPDASAIDLQWELPFPGTAVTFAPDGFAWVTVSEPPGLVRVDQAGGTTFFVGTDENLVPTAVDVDAEGRVWFAATHVDAGGAVGRFDPVTETFLYVPLGSAPKAVVGTPDGLVIVSLPAQGELVGMDSDTPDLTATLQLPGCTPWGLFPAGGADLHVFCTGESKLLTVALPEGTLSMSHETEPKPEALGNHRGLFPWLWFAPEGTYRHVLESPGGLPVKWTGLSVQGQVVGGGSCKVTARVRWAETKELLEDAAWSDPGPVLLPPPGEWDTTGLSAVGAFLEVELLLQSPASMCTPALHLVSVGFVE